MNLLIKYKFESNHGAADHCSVRAGTETGGLETRQVGCGDPVCPSAASTQTIQSQFGEPNRDQGETRGNWLITRR